MKPNILKLIKLGLPEDMVEVNSNGLLYINGRKIPMRWSLEAECLYEAGNKEIGKVIIDSVKHALQETVPVNEPRVQHPKLPTANSNHPKTEEEKTEIINKAEKAYEGFLDALDINWREDPNSAGTPRRVAKAYVCDLIRGCYDYPPKITTFPSDGYDGIVSQCNIPVVSMCSHHHLAFSGIAHVAYIPSLTGRVIGLSKINRIVEHYARRPQVQEALTMQIHKALNEICEGNQGVAIVLKCQHTCACYRGVKHHGCAMITSKLSGDFMNEIETRKEFYDFVASAERNQ